MTFAAAAGVVPVAVAGAALALLGTVWGRAVPKVHPVGEVCSTCDGPASLRDVAPWAVPARCPVCDRTVGGPAIALVVLVGGILAALYGLGDRGWLLVANGVLGLSLTGLVWTDARYRLLPARMVWSAVTVSLAVFAAAEVGSTESRLLEAGLVALASGALFFGLHRVNPAGMAFGDVRLALLLGLHLGWRSPAAAYLGFLLALLLAYVVGQVRKRTRGDNTLPFGPFLAIGAAAALVVAAT